MLLVLYLAFGGVLSVVGAMMYLGLPFSLLTCLVSGGTIFGVYLLNRFTDVREDFANDTVRSVFFVSHRSLLRLAYVAFTGVVVTLVLTGSLNAYFMSLLLLGVVYSCRLVPWYEPGRGLRFVRLKDTPLVKNVLVSALWGVSVFAVPLLLSRAHPASIDLYPVGLLAAAMMLSTFNSTFFGDIMDMDGDRLVGTTTLPTMLGERRSLLLQTGVNVAWLGTIGWLSWLRPGYCAETAFVAVLATYPAAYLVPFSRKWLARRSLEFLAELDLVVFAVGMVVLSVVRG